MPNPSRQSTAPPRPVWGRLCQWLFRGLLFIWGTVVLGLVLNIGATLLTTKGFDPTGTPLEFIIQHLSVAIACGGGLLALTIVTGILGRQDESSVTHDQYNYVGPLPYDPNQKTLLQIVHRDWIEGVLERSLHKNLLIPLELREEPEMVLKEENPWDAVVPQQPQELLKLSPDASPYEVYNAASCRLLVLGEPGSGKTTFLLQLARTLLDQAAQGKEQYLPVIFHLSFWAKELSIKEWLVQELKVRYKVPKNTAQSWVEGYKILPLLDGFDEVISGLREQCAKKINDYIGMAPIVVCSRRDEYQALKERFHLPHAICIQPLTEKQVQDYLSSIDILEEPLRKHVFEDAQLKDLLKTPLMVRIFVQAFQGKSIEDLENLDKKEASRQSNQLRGTLDGTRLALFEVYVENMFEHRERRIRYRRQEVMRQLSWLAQELSQRHLTQFSFGQVYSDWIPSTHDYRFLCRFTIRSIAFCIGFLFSISLLLPLAPHMGWQWLYVPLGALGAAWMSVDSKAPNQVINSLPKVIGCAGFLGFMTLIIVGLPAFLLSHGSSSLWSWMFFQGGSIVFLFVFGLTMMFGLVGWITKPRLSSVSMHYRSYRMSGYIEHKISLLFLRSLGLASLRSFEHATSCQLLYKVGREYMFIHPLLLAYFMTLDITIE